MSHLHIPDGLLSPGWTAVWTALAGVLLIMSVFFLRRHDLRRIVPRVGIFTALLLLAMSMEWFGLYHLNLTTLAAMVLGPWAACLSIFMANVAMALVGHGGLTVLGLNTVILCVEAFVGWALFVLLGRVLKKPMAAFITTVMALTISFVFMVSAVSVSVGPISEWWHGHEGGKWVTFDLLGKDHRDDHDQPALEDKAPQHHESDLPDHEAPPKRSSKPALLSSFLRVMIIPGLIGWPIEALIVSSLVGFLFKVRPDLVGGRYRK